MSDGFNLRQVLVAATTGEGHFAIEFCDLCSKLQHGSMRGTDKVRRSKQPILMLGRQNNHACQPTKKPSTHRFDSGEPGSPSLSAGILEPEFDIPNLIGFESKSAAPVSRSQFPKGTVVAPVMNPLNEVFCPLLRFLIFFVITEAHTPQRHHPKISDSRLRMKPVDKGYAAVPVP